MPARARPLCLALVAFTCGSLAIAGVACKTNDAPANEAAETEPSELAKLEKELTKVTSERDQAEAELESVRAKLDSTQACRTRNIDSLRQYGTLSDSEVTGRVAAAAIAQLEQRVAARRPDEKLALVLDIDETTLNNYELLTQSEFCFTFDQWIEWSNEGKPTAIAGMGELIEHAQNKGVAVVFITSRSEDQRAVTVRALEGAGIRGWNQLILRTDSDPDSTTKYKSEQRAKLEQQGFTIILNIGDQPSDIDGGHAEQTMLMPNPFYALD